MSLSIKIPESSPAGTDVEAPEQPRLSYKEMRRTTVVGCRHADGSLEQGGTISLQVIVVAQPDKTKKLAASCKISTLQDPSIFAALQAAVGVPTAAADCS